MKNYSHVYDDLPVKNKRILLLSDSHKGHDNSRFWEYEAQIMARARTYDHVVMIGDIFELWFLKPIPGKSLREVYQSAVDSAKDWLEDFLKENPDVKLHYVIGNHDNILELREALDDLQSKYSNFEWHHTGIRIGNAFITHGDLQTEKEYQDTDQTRILYKVDDTANFKGWLKRGVKYLERLHHKTRKHTFDAYPTIQKITRWMNKYDGNEHVTYSHEGREHTFAKDWIEHVFCGHTHVKYSNRDASAAIVDEDKRNECAVLHHNCGGFTAGHGRNVKDLGVLEAELNAGQKIANIRELNIELPAQWHGKGHTHQANDFDEACLNLAKGPIGRARVFKEYVRENGRLHPSHENVTQVATHVLGITSRREKRDKVTERV